jgi:AcrR family transcriptional regulator
MTETTTGLRERKKRETREALARAGLELFVERGYDATTLADIADAAGVSTRTIFAYFPSKEDILFSSLQTTCDALALALAERPEGQDAFDALREFILSSEHEKSELDHKLEQVIADSETLHRHKRARIAQVQELLAAAIADDLGAGPDDLRASVAAASLTAAFEVLERQERGVQAPRSNEDIAAAIDPILSFVRAGLQALPAPGRAAAAP